MHRISQPRPPRVDSPLPQTYDYLSPTSTFTPHNIRLRYDSHSFNLRYGSHVYKGLQFIQYDCRTFPSNSLPLRANRSVCNQLTHQVESVCPTTTFLSRAACSFNSFNIDPLVFYIRTFPNNEPSFLSLLVLHSRRRCPDGTHLRAHSMRNPSSASYSFRIPLLPLTSDSSAFSRTHALSPRIMGPS